VGKKNRIRRKKEGGPTTVEGVPPIMLELGTKTILASGENHGLRKGEKKMAQTWYNNYNVDAGLKTWKGSEKKTKSNYYGKTGEVLCSHAGS